MPERVFKYHTTPELKVFIRSLAQSLTTGNTQELRNNHMGFLVRTGPLKPADIRRVILDVRYEIYEKGKCGDQAAAILEPKDPRYEKVMAVEVNRTWCRDVAGLMPDYYV